MSERYEIMFDFDIGGEPPSVFIFDNETDYRIAEILEAPVMSGGGKLVEVESGVWDWQGAWSWDPEDWRAGEIAMKILDLLNGNT